jgi:adenine-specific DNA-methyltransferase
MSESSSTSEPETELLTSPDPVPENIAKLGELFPEAVTEDGINLEVLAQLLGEETELADGAETYGLSWNGKRLARQIAITPSTGTLRPAPEDSVEWDTTQNVVIEGDNLEVLKLLKSAYAGKVKLIYIDPPYNTGKDFVYKDDFRDNIANYLEQTGQVDEDGNRLSTNTETSGRFHTDWLNMMYPRLKLARDLLSEDGVLMVSVDESEIGNLLSLVSELFGDSNVMPTVIWKRKSGGANDSLNLARDHEYVVLASKVQQGELLGRLPYSEKLIALYSERDEYVASRGPYRPMRLDQKGLNYSPSLDYPIEGPDGEMIFPEGDGTIWRWSKETFIKRHADGFIEFKQVGKHWRVITKQYLHVDYDDQPIERGQLLRSVITDVDGRDGIKEIQDLFGKKVFNNPKALGLMRLLCDVGTRSSSIILDFFAGSGTTGHAVMAQNAEDGGNRRYILVQLPEPLDPDVKEQKVAADFCDELGKPHNIAELTKERLRRAGEKVKEDNPDFDGDTGFRVFKLDSTNVRAWDPDMEDLNQTLIDSIETLKEGRDDDDVLYEVLLKLGLDLCVPIETETLGGLEVSSIGAGTLFACMADELDSGSVEELGQGILDWKKTLDPAGDVTCLFKDGAFTGDQAKTNLVEILKQGGIKTVRCV